MPRFAPDRCGPFGPFGGRYVPDTLMPAVEALAKAYDQARKDPGFRRELEALLKTYAGRPTPLTPVKRLGEAYRLRVYLKREDLLHTGAHKLNHCLGQALLAKRMGKRRLIAETGAGQHGVATATVAARFGLPCRIYMGQVDMARQEANVKRMRLLGAEVMPVTSGSQTLTAAINEALRDWVAHPKDTYYLLGSVLGPDPYPRMVGDFQAVLGREARKQIREAEGRLPHAAVACVGGGSNAIGLFRGFLKDRAVSLFGVEAAGRGVPTGRHAAPLAKGKPGVLHGTRSFLLQDAEGQVMETHSISAGLDYPGVGPEHSWLKARGRAKYLSATDEQALAAFRDLAKLEGILPALESAHALAGARLLARRLPKRALVVVNLSGRGDKDLGILA